MKPNPSDISSLKKFFSDNQEMTTYELARLANRSASTIRNWKRKCDIKAAETKWGSNRESTPFINKPAYKKRKIDLVRDPEIWDNEDWFRQQYEDKRFGIPIISRMINRSIPLVRGRLKKYGIETRTHHDSVKSTNTCCNKDWLEEYYIKKGWPIAKCAQEAGVVPYTIYNWLIKFQFEIRDIYEAMAGERNPFHGRKHSEETKNKIRQKIVSLREISGNGSPHKKVSKRPKQA